MGANQDQYRVLYSGPVAIGEDVFRVRVHWARVGGRFQVVGVDLRTFYSDAEDQAARAILGAGVDPLQDPWGEVTATAMRGLRLTEVVEASRQYLLASLEEAAPAPADGAAEGSVREALEGVRRKRGPAPVIPDEALEAVVAPAYATGGTKPVEAVRQALAAAGYHKGHVTPDQARKAVERARKSGFIPAYRGRKA